MYSSNFSRELKRYLTVRTDEEEVLGSTLFRLILGPLLSRSTCDEQLLVPSTLSSLVPKVVSRTNTCTYMRPMRVKEANIVNTHEDPRAYTKIGVTREVRNVNSIMVMLDTPTTLA